MKLTKRKEKVKYKEAIHSIEMSRGLKKKGKTVFSQEMP